jgi:sugar phosphate isomerase/epimerase
MENNANRRSFLKNAALGLTGLTVGAASGVQAQEPPKSASGARRGNPIAVSSYSYWHFAKDKAPMDWCLRQAADAGFDAFEVLEKQLDRVDLPYLKSLRRDAFKYGLSLCCMSTHQTFVRPDAEEREKNIEITKNSVEMAAEMGIPAIRVNTGRWDSWGSFDALMEHRGIENPLPGHTDEEAFGWVVDAFEKILPCAEKNGVMLCLENHWGLARTADGLIKVLDAIDSPYFGCCLDTGNFLDDTVEQFEKVLPRAHFVQAKTYYGGGLWYSLPLDYAKYGELFRKYNYRGFVSLEFEGKENPATAIPKSLALLRENLYFNE